MSRRRMMMAQQKKENTLPDSYTRLQYIRGTSRQYFNTGVYADGYTGARYKYSLAKKMMYGPYVLSGSGFGAFPFFRGKYSTAVGIIFINRDGLITIDKPYEINTPYEFFVDKNGDIYLDDEFIVSIGNGKETSNNHDEIPIYFGIYCGELNSTGLNTYGFNGNLYYCQIFQNGIIVRDFVPCINPEGVAGLYDTVEGVFYRSETGTDFEAGEVLT